MHGTSLSTLIESHGPQGFYHKVCQLLNEKQLTPDDFSYHELAEACGVLPHLRSLRESPLSDGPVSTLLSESSPGVSTSLFQVVTGELIGRKVIEGYADDSGFIGDRLVTVMPSRLRNSRIAGFTALAGPSEVPEGHPYEESSFTEKSVTTLESKQGRILSINEELIAFDQTGEINRRAMALGYYLRQERERTIVRAVIERAGDSCFKKPIDTGFSPLHQAVYANADAEMCDFIINGAPFSTTAAQDHFHRTALHYAMVEDKWDAAFAIIKASNADDLALTDWGGSSPLMLFLRRSACTGMSQVASDCACALVRAMRPEDLAQRAQPHLKTYLAEALSKKLISVAEALRECMYPHDFEEAAKELWDEADDDWKLILTPPTSVKRA